MFDNRKQLVLALIIMTVLSAALFTCSASHIQNAHAQNNNTSANTTATTKDYRQYDNSTLGIKIQVPSDWLYKEINNTAVAFVSAPNSTSKAAVVVYIEKVPRGMSLVNFTQRNIQYLEQTTPSFHLITSNLTTLAGSPAYQIAFTSLSDTGHDFRKGMSIWTLKDDKAYILTYRAEPGLVSFNTQLPIVSYMIKSFEIIG